MTVQKGYRLDDELAKAVEDEAKQRGISETELAIEYLEHGLKCKKTEQSDTMHLAINSNPDAVCVTCKNKMDVGAYFMRGHGTEHMCLDCHSQRYPEKATVRLVMQEKELKYKNECLEKALDEKAKLLAASDIHQELKVLAKLDVERLQTKQEARETSIKTDKLETSYLMNGHFTSSEEHELLLQMKESRELREKKDQREEEKECDLLNRLNAVEDFYSQFVERRFIRRRQRKEQKSEQQLES